MKTDRFLPVFILSIIVFLSPGCTPHNDQIIGPRPSADLTPADNVDVIANGTIVYLPFEGGFYGLIADDSSRYNPVNLDQKYKSNNIRVNFEGRVSENQNSIHMWGTIIEISRMQRLTDYDKNDR